MIEIYDMRADVWEVEMAIGGILVAAGLALLLAWPPPWWPDMGRYLIDIGLWLGLTFLFVGLALVAVAGVRRVDQNAPRRIIVWWDSMWTKKRVLVAISVALLATLVLPGIWVSAIPSDAVIAQTAKPSQGDTGTAQSVNGPAVGVQKNSGPTYNAPVTINPPPKPQTSSKKSDPPSINGNCNNSGQNGSVTCNFYNQVPEVKIHPLGQLSATANPDGTFTSTVLVFVEPQTPLVAVACGPDVVSINMTVWTGFMTSSSIKPLSDGCTSAYNPNVYGQWAVKVTLKQKDSSFNLNFQKPF